MGKSTVFNKRWLILLVCGLALIIVPAHAQTDYPPVLNPADFLADGVELIETQPILNTDDAARTVYYFNPASNLWTSYAYPEDVQLKEYEYWEFDQNPDGTYLLYSVIGYVIYPDPFLDNTWQFDPISGEFTRPEAVCNRVKAQHGYGTWVPYKDPTTGRNVLCFTETGQLFEPIPNDLPVACAGSTAVDRPTTSPDNQWYIYATCFLPFTIYAYNPTERKFYTLGTNSEANEYPMFRWIDNTHVAIYSSLDATFTYRHILVADVTRPNSLKQIARRYLEYPAYFDAPPRFEYVLGEFNDGGPRQSCAIHIYDVTKFETIIYDEIPGVCGSGFIIPDGSGDRLYRVVNDDRSAKESTLIRFNPETGKRVELFSGEIEWIQNVSPDGHYAVLLMDNGGEYVWHDREVLHPQWAGFELVSPQLVIFDLLVGEVVYDALLSNEYNGKIRSHWTDSKTLLVEDSEHSHDIYTASIIRLGEEQASTSTVYLGKAFGGKTLRELVSPDGRYLLVWIDDPKTQRKLVIYDLVTGETVALTKPLDDRYWFNFVWQSNETLLINVDEVTSTNRFGLAGWLVRVPRSD